MKSGPDLGGNPGTIHLFKGVRIAALGYHNFSLEPRISCTGMTSIEQIMDIVNLHHGTGADPGILAASAPTSCSRGIHIPRIAAPNCAKEYAQ